ncbi:MAG: ATP-binding cassette domain-containing protein [Pseudomonadota bacterium]
MTRTVETDDISFAYRGGELSALESFSLAVEPGEQVALLGPSGAGKTTFLTLLDGRLRGWTGRAAVLGKALDPARPPPRTARPDVGFIFQEFALVERSTVLRNVLNGRLGRMTSVAAILGRHAPRDLAIARQAMADCGIAELADRRVDTLSGGQRQRVAIARCLAQEPRLILADEPVSNLDPARASDVLNVITAAAARRGATTIFTSHQPDLAVRFASRMVGMSEGRIAFDQPVENALGDDIAALYHADAPHLRVVQ